MKVLKELKKKCFYYSLAAVVLTLLVGLIVVSVLHNVVLQCITIACLMCVCMLIIIIILFTYQKKHALYADGFSSPIIYVNKANPSTDELLQHAILFDDKASPHKVNADKQVLADENSTCDDRGCSLQLTSEN